MNRPIQVAPPWQDLLARLERGRPWRILFVVGATGSGKTTLCRFLGAELSKRWRTTAVDCDPGQSALGPPTCVSMAWEPYRGGRPLAMRFVGSTSPAGHFLQALTGIKRLVERALEVGAQKVVLDSSGFIGHPAGQEFHFQTLDVVQPDHIVVLQQGQELESLVASFTRRAGVEVHRLPVSAAVLERSREQRREYREKRFAAYFRRASLRQMPVAGLGMHGMVPDLRDSGTWRGLLVSPCDRRGFAVALGILEDVELDSHTLKIYAPPFDPERIASVQFGSIRLDRSGRELFPFTC